MATASIVTENYCRLNFTPKSGVTPGTNDTLAMSCDQIAARYNVTISGVTTTGNRCPAQNELTASVVQIQNPDYIVLKYYWTSNDGIDLDTATEFINSSISGLDYQPIGWDLDSNVLNVLRFGGDNTASGNETALINLAVLRGYSGLAAVSQADMYANWYGTKLNGNVTIELKAYQGGTMSQSGFSWINTGGTLLTTLNFQKQVTTVGHANVINFRSDYTYLGNMTYTKANSFISLNF